MIPVSIVQSTARAANSEGLEYKRGMKKETTLTIVLAIFIFDLHYTCGDEHIPLLEEFSTPVKNKRGESKEVMVTSIGGSEYPCNQLATPLGGDENKKQRTKRLNCNRVRKKRTLAANLPEEAQAALRHSRKLP